MTFSLPTITKIRAANFRPAPHQALNPARGGQHQGVKMGETLWLCDVSTTELSRAQAGAYKWLRAKLDGQLETLYLYDAERPRPLHYLRTYAGVGTPPWGEPRIVAMDAAAGTIDLEDFEPGAVISEGDYGHWDDGPARRLHITGAGVADGSGDLTLEVRPRPPRTETLVSPIDFIMEKACAEMSVLQFEAPFNLSTTQVTLSALQVIRRY